MALPLYIVDAFTSHAFAGNPAAICVLEKPADPAWMQQVAAEMNLSETAFVVPQAEGFGLRWFTPTVEVDLCGHATLAAAHALWREQGVPGETLKFSTRSGVLTCTREGEWIRMDFPAVPPGREAPPVELTEALGLSTPPRAYGRSRFDALLELDSEQAVRDVQPDFGRLGAIPIRGAIVTARSSDRRFDFVSRFFAPAVGVNEDPVCGSAHCCLGPYWSAALGKTELVGHQISARGGVIRISVGADRVLLSGQAVTTVTGKLRAAPCEG